jgi:uncharacterized DUF497 family protein
VEFEWDESKHRRNLRERAIGFDLAARIFDGDRAEHVDQRFTYGEIRIKALGEVDGLILHVVYTRRGERYRIISARRA